MGEVCRWVRCVDGGAVCGWVWCVDEHCVREVTRE